MHTQGKWTVIKDKYIQYHIIGELQRPVGEIHNKEDADRIVKMHNSFDGLLEACESAEIFLNDLIYLPEASSDINKVALHTCLRDAIAKAEDK